MGRVGFEHEVHAPLHDVLNLKVTGRVHDHELLAGGHGELAGVAEGENLLETGRRDGRGQLELGFGAAAEEVAEIQAAGRQHGPVSLESLTLHQDGHVAVLAR